MICADDLAVVADSEADLQECLGEWKEIFGRHRLRVSLEKTEVLWVGQQKKTENRGDGHLQENISWGECMEESGRVNRR